LRFAQAATSTIVLFVSGRNGKMGVDVDGVRDDAQRDVDAGLPGPLGQPRGVAEQLIAL
jgi:hypothetical protein